MTKLLEGYYKAIDHFYKFVKNAEGTCAAHDGGGTDYPLTVQYGDFGEADPRIQEKSGIKNYNVKLILNFGKNENEAMDKSEESEKKKKMMEFIDIGIVYDEGRKCAMKGAAGISGLEKINEEELETILNDCDPIEAPPGSYKIQPENQGKLLWFTGAPGMGKSTTAQILARSHDYVYYEADCFGSLKNPYIPLDVENPSMAQIHQKNLAGPGLEERKALIQKTQEMWMQLINGEEYDQELLLEFHHHMALDIAREKARIGGDWAVACVLLTKAGRAELRKILGPDLVIICLTMSDSERRERVLGRHQGDVSSADMMDHFGSLMEPVDEDEENTIVLKVTSAMTREEVVDLVRKAVQ